MDRVDKKAFFERGAFFAYEEGGDIRKLLILPMLLALMVSAVGAVSLGHAQSDAELLARLIEAEARGEPYEGMVAVGNVVLNRLHDGRWGGTLEKVVYAKGQFARPAKTYSEACYRAAVEALDGVKVLPDNILFFQRARMRYFYAPWYCSIGNHNFYGGEKA